MASNVFQGHNSSASIPATSEKRTSRRFSVEEVGFFEGPEKLLEVWFDLCPLTDDASCAVLPAVNGCDYERGLRVFPRSKWEELLTLVNCEILSCCSNDHMDAYLLSESSMFVSSNRFVLKTCGNTTLLHAIKPLFQLVGTLYPQHKVTAFFYSHRSFQKPQLQLHPHQSFEEEVRYLDEIFEDGAGYALGRVNGDTWYLYSMCSVKTADRPDHTLEILMTDLDPDIMSLYSPEAYSSAKLLMQDTGIDEIVPEAMIDSKIFEPCGFSVNAIIKGDKYFTIHVTPQVECSWVSFETNLVTNSHSALVAKVLDIFKPRSFSVSLFVSKSSMAEEPNPLTREKSIRGYQCKDKQFCSLAAYDLSFSCFSLSKSSGKNNIQIASV